MDDRYASFFSFHILLSITLVVFDVLGCTYLCVYMRGLFKVEQGTNPQPTLNRLKAADRPISARLWRQSPYTSLCLVPRPHISSHRMPACLYFKMALSSKHQFHMPKQP